MKNRAMMGKPFFRRLSFYILFIALIPFLNLINIYAINISEDAESYRLKGYEAQQNGDIDNAISWYQKACSLDPNYAAPHNDLGILFEAKAWLDRAESEYQRALAIDHNYSSAHTNLALLYERKGELEKAAFHWMKRFNLGRPGDLWTEEARQRLQKLGLIETKERLIELPKEEQIAPKRREEVSRKERPGEWTRLRSEPKKKAEEKGPAIKKSIKPEDRESDLERELQRSIELEEKRARREKGEEKQRQNEKRTRDADYLNSIKLAEERLRKDREKEMKEENKRRALERDMLEREMQRSLEIEERRLKKEGLKADESKVRKTKEEAPIFFKNQRKGGSEKELQASLILAEERLKRERKEKGAINTANQRKETDARAKSYYYKANSYNKNGEYSRALDTIRIAKNYYPDDQDLSMLEQTIKNKMKEERIEDHYNEGILHYRQDDFAGARKEFEAILNILPE